MLNSPSGFNQSILPHRHPIAEIGIVDCIILMDLFQGGEGKLLILERRLCSRLVRNIKLMGLLNLQEQADKRLDIIDYGCQIRGMVIARFILLETVINFFLSWHLSETRNSILLESLFSTGRITFDGKRGLFMDLIKQHHEDFYEINKGTKNNSGINKRLQRLSEERNVFAHHILDTSESAILAFESSKELRFLKYYDDPAASVYTEKMVDDLMTRITIDATLINTLDVG